jgi:PhoPQ-activated pathogenicity-related protein
MNRNYLKPLVAGVIAATLDNVFLKQTIVSSNAIFGASVGIGCWLASLAAPAVVAVVPTVGDTTLMNTKTLAVRLSEIGLGLGTSWAINKYVAMNDYNVTSRQRNEQLAVIAVSDFVAEYVADYMTGSELNYLTAAIN